MWLCTSVYVLFGLCMNRKRTVPCATACLPSFPMAASSPPTFPSHMTSIWPPSMHFWIMDWLLPPFGSFPSTTSSASLATSRLQMLPRCSLLKPSLHNLSGHYHPRANEPQIFLPIPDSTQTQNRVHQIPPRTMLPVVEIMVLPTQVLKS